MSVAKAAAATRAKGEAVASALIRGLTPRNLLSFGPETPPLQLHPLNVVIGPNGSGKSNLLEAVALLRSTPGDPQAVLRRGGGVREWIWKGAPDAPVWLHVMVSFPHGPHPLQHFLLFGADAQSFRLLDERIEEAVEDPDAPAGRWFYRRGTVQPALFMRSHELQPSAELLSPNESVLAQRRSPEVYPEITYLAGRYAAIRIYREWAFGHSTILRRPQQADARSDRLEEDFSNLGLVLNRLRRHQPTKRLILERLRDLYDGLTDFDVSVEGGTVQVFLAEGDFSIPATRLSDGTLRYLCLLAILCDPNPPPLICIEEPELGLHPDILPKIADLLVEASARTQLIVTTHSTTLVDSLGVHPEAVIVCEKHEGCTEMRRLDPAALAVWLERYSLGELWTSGNIGGTRW